MLPILQALAAESSDRGGITLPDPIAGGTLTSVIQSIFDFLVQVSAIIAPILIVVGAFQMITAAGSPEKFARGRNTIVYTAIGFIVVLMARGIVSIVQDIVTP